MFSENLITFFSSISPCKKQIHISIFMISVMFLPILLDTCDADCNKDNCRRYQCRNEGVLYCYV